MALFDILDDEKLLRIQNGWFDRLQGVSDGKFDVGKGFRLKGILAPWTNVIYEDPERFIDESLEFVANKAEVLLEEDVFRPLTVSCGAYGVHYIDKILGAEVFQRDDWYNNYLTTPVGTLKAPDYMNDPTVQLTLRMAKRFTEVGGRVP
ncbi:MAG: hypothetical protein MJ072_04545, partial [Clostridia bacterium]|nr:hypothetical protein [Clostridia bacterium]